MDNNVPKIWNGKESQANIAGANIPVDDSAEYKLVWNDEFELDRLDLRKWSSDGSGCWSGDYKFCLTGELWRFENSVGTLIMEKFDKPDENGKLYWDAGSFITNDTMNFAHGYLEMRAKVPFLGKGEFPAFWLLSHNAVLARRDPSYKNPDYKIEIDIFENFSSKNGLVPNIHKYENVPEGRHCQLSGIDQGASKNGTRTFRFPDNIDPNDWHTYGFLWTENLMSFSVDGEFYYTYDLRKNFGPFGGTEGFHQPVGIIISNQIFSEGWTKVSDWAASIGAAKEEIFPLEYSVDYVRLYQKPGNTLYVNALDNRVSPLPCRD